jgi:methylenetetrahydrofolate dehydrogenase (NADP+) / methenyltetrahydrofolate cyclohydrolase
MTVLDGRTVATKIAEDLKTDIRRLRTEGVIPCLAVVIVGDDPAAAFYLRLIERTADRLSLACAVHKLPESTMKDDVLSLVGDLNEDTGVHGIVVQTPLPPYMDIAEIGARVAVVKDVDAINPTTAGQLFFGLPSFVPATAAAVMEILHQAAIPIRGSRAVVIGRSTIVGRPTASLLLQEDATVTICHSKTVDLPVVAREADILVVAIGQPGFVDAEFVKSGATVIDVGTNVTDNGMVGDVDFEAIAPLAGVITPVPGGVGPVTTMMLLRQVVAAAAFSEGET